RRPGGVVGLHADEGDVDRFFLGELLRVGDMERAHRHGEFRFLHRMRYAKPVLAHMFDMSGPRIDKGDVFAGLDHVRARITTDGAGAHDGNLSTHTVLPFQPGDGKLAGASALRHSHQPGFGASPTADYAEACLSLQTSEDTQWRKKAV